MIKLNKDSNSPKMERASAPGVKVKKYNIKGIITIEAALAIPLFLFAAICLIYLIEVLSVIIQVTYFKATHGKRIFKMAPIHHHFELCGWSETRVVAVFSVITAVMCMVALLAL